ncbi:MAG: hypothetical protein ACYDGM_12375 [Vulcanimicrobiaceae bacterium]
MTAYRTNNVVPLTERNGAPRHEDDKTTRVIQAAVEAALREHDRTLVAEVRQMAARVEKGFHRLADTVEAFVTGDKEVAVAAISPEACDDLPSISAYKANATLIYSLKASDVAEQLGLARGVVSFLLNGQGLDWVTRHPELWDKDLYLKTRRRLWHFRVTELLRNVIVNGGNPDRDGVSLGCKRLLEEGAIIIRHSPVSD